jgi:sugar lactone lactonase YvrE
VALAVDSEGNLFCSDEHLNIIASYNDDGERIGEWGEVGSDEGQLNGPNGIAFDADDNLYVVDSGNGRVQKFTKDGSFLATFGSAGSDEGQFDKPWGITVDSSGDLFVADWGNDRVQKFSAGGTHLMTFGSAAGGELNHPSSVAVDSEGDVYVADWGNKRIQIYEPDGNVITSLHGDAVEFSAWAAEVINANPDAQKAYRRVQDRTQIGLLDRPVGITIDADDNLIITDSTRGRLQVYTKEKDYMDPQFNL